MKKTISLLLALLLLCALLPNSLPQAQAAEAGYDLYVYGVQVTEANKNDIFQNGESFRYDPVRNELTIGPFIASEHDLVENHIDGLTVRIPQGWDNERDDLIATNGHSLIKSSCDIKIHNTISSKAPRLSTDGQAPVIAVTGDSTLTIDHAFLEIKGGSAAISGSDDPTETQTLILRTSYLKIDGVQAAVQNMRGGVSLENTGIYDAGEAEAVYFRDGALTDADGTALQTICFAPTVKVWDLKIDGVIVYEDTKDDILEDGGSVRFDPDTQTLTLNNPVFGRITGNVIWSGLDNLTICGSGTIISEDMLAICGGWESLITLDGDFTIGTRKKDMLDVPAIYTAGILCFGGGNINIFGNENGVVAEGGILFSGGTVEIRCSRQAVLVSYEGSIDFTNGMTILEPVGAKYPGGGGCNGYYIGAGKTIGTDKHTAAKLKVGTEPQNPFADVEKGADYYNAVLWAFYHKPYQVTAGIDKTHFGPDRTVTRAQAMTFFWAAKDRPKFKKASTQFVDVKKTDWYYKAVMWAVEKKITAGTDATHFSPNKTCNRGEILTFLYAAVGKPKVKIQNPYIDVTNQWYKKAALWAFEQRLERGELACFNASTPCTRASTVTYLYRFLTGYALVE